MSQSLVARLSMLKTSDGSQCIQHYCHSVETEKLPASLRSYISLSDEPGSVCRCVAVMSEGFALTAEMFAGCKPAKKSALLNVVYALETVQ